MSITKKYCLAAVQLDDTPDDVLISGIATQNLRLGTELDSIVTSGEVFPRWLSVKSQAPTADFGTYHLATAFLNATNPIGLAGLSIVSLTTGLVLWLQKHADGGTRAGATSHRSYTIKKGIIVPQTLSCAFQGDALATFRITPIWDGTNNPVIPADSLSLPWAGSIPGAGTEDDDERFTLGPVKVGNKALTQVRAIDIDFGVNVVPEGGDSDVWPTFCSIETISPRLTLRGIDPEWFADAAIPLAGLAGTHANTIIYLRKRLAGGTFVLDATVQHIKITAAGLAYIEDAFTASGTGAAETNLVMPLRFDGTNLPLTMGLSAITA